MEFQEIIYDVRDKIATITLNRPDKLNAWTFKMESEYRHAMADAEKREDVRVIVVTGAGRGFCAGADMGLLTSLQGGDIDTSDLKDSAEAMPGAHPDTREDFQKQYSFPAGIRKPVICAVNGHAMGIGMVHTLYCDIRIAGSNAKFGTAFVQRGLIAEYGIAWLLPRLIGFEKAMDLLFSGRIITADEALQMGLVSRVVPQEELMDKVYEYATHLATKCSPRSMGVMKKQVWDALLTDLGPAVDVAIQEMLESFGSEDFSEGVVSFIEKRPPNFSGR